MKLNIAVLLLMSAAGACESKAPISPDGGGGGTAGTGGTVGSGGVGTGGRAGGAGAGGAPASGGATGSGGAGGSTGSGGIAGAGGTTSSGGRGGGAGAGGTGGAGGLGGTTGSGGTAGSTAMGGAGGGASPCQAVLALDRSCTTAADCFGGGHVISCCGQVHFVGFRGAEQARFQALEAACDATYPPCGCAAQEPLADDGSRLRWDQQPGVTCQQGVCTTFVSDCGQPCAAGTTCFSCSNHQSVFAACTSTCTSSTVCQDPALPLCQMGSSGNVSGMFCTASNVACDTK